MKKRVSGYLILRLFVLLPNGLEVNLRKASSGCIQFVANTYVRLPREIASISFLSLNDKATKIPYGAFPRMLYHNRLTYQHEPAINLNMQDS